VIYAQGGTSGEVATSPSSPLKDSVMETPVKKDRVSTIENDNKVLRRFYDPTGRPRIGFPDAQRARWSSGVLIIATVVLLGAVIGVGIWLIAAKVIL
jgi:hypothetical protein